MIIVKIRLFGFLQDCCKDKIIEIKAENGSTVGTIKQKLSDFLSDKTTDQRIKDLPENCVLANETEIILDDIILDSDVDLVVIPPICGG